MGFQCEQVTNLVSLKSGPPPTTLGLLPALFRGLPEGDSQARGLPDEAFDNAEAAQVAATVNALKNDASNSLVTDDQLLEEFKKFDVNNNGWLDKTGVVAAVNSPTLTLFSSFLLTA